MNTTQSTPPPVDPLREGSAAAQRLGSDRHANPYPAESEDAVQWAKGYEFASQRLNDLFTSWIALGHSVPLLAVGSSGQALGPMVSGLIASNGNAIGALLIGACAAHRGEALVDILPADDGETRGCLEASQFAILGEPYPEGFGFRGAYENAKKIDDFRTDPSEFEETADGRKVARATFDLAAFLKFIVEGPGKEDA